ncbi:MAG: hypothetical protein SV760_00220 [Halobacteria archaeon]|nr:hypothetical protein [Halobacteria archaeon]
MNSDGSSRVGSHLFGSVLPMVPLYKVFGLKESSTTYWSIVLVVALVIIGFVVLNQIASGTLILKE